MHNWQKKLVAMGFDPKPCELYNLEVHHDLTCGVYQGRQWCDCDPDVIIHRAKDIDEFGEQWLKLQADARERCRKAFS